jgi:DNA (cytosine-5)-methyltransferase 1
VKPRLLDLFCGAGGCTKGYQEAGFYVVGVDIKPQPNYPGDKFYEADALDVLRDGMWWGDGLGRLNLHEFAEDFDAIHASPPCQASSTLRHLWKDREHPELIPPTRELLVEAGLPYVIENVVGAKLIEPFVLCGSMFGNGAGGRQLRRHRLFETNFPVMVPTCQHRGQPVGVYGHGGGGSMTRGYKGSKAEYQEAMEMPWATKAEIAQAIPPSYTEFIGGYLMQAVEQEQAAA